MAKKRLVKKYSIILFIVLLILAIISVFISIKYPELIPIKLTSPGYPEVEFPTDIEPVTTGPCRGLMMKCEYYHDSFTCEEVCGCDWNQWSICAIPSGGRSKTCSDLKTATECNGCGCTWVGETQTNIAGLEEIKITCKENNPTATDEYCNDVAYHDIAIMNKDIVLCEKIINGWLKEHCIRSLR